MTYVLYGDIGSGSAIVDMALAEAGQTPERRSVPLEGDHQLRDEYRAINPMGRIPTLILPEGTVVTEHLAILLTIVDRHPEAALLPPPGDSGRALALRWMALLAGEFYPHVTRSDYPERFSTDPESAPGIRDRARQMGREIMSLIETHSGLQGRPDVPFLLGRRFTLADLPIAVMSRWMGGRSWTPANYPKIQVLAEAVAARPAVASLWAMHKLGGD